MPDSRQRLARESEWGREAGATAAYRLHMKVARAAMQSAVFALVLLASVAAVTEPAGAAPPVVAADLTRPSAVELTGATTYLLNGTSGLRNVVCLAFVNHGTGLATKVGLSLAMLDATGTVVGVDVMYPTGKFPVGVRSAFSGSRDTIDVPNGNCHAINSLGATQRSSFTFRPNKDTPLADVAAILVSTREIVYQDGTAFRTDEVPKTGDHLALPVAPAFTAAVPDGPPVVSFATVNGSPIEVTDAFATETVVRTGGVYNGGGLLGVIAAMPVTTRSRSYCMTFANRDPRDVKFVRVNLAVLDRTGKVVGLETLDSKGPFAQATTGDSGIACEGIRGKLDADTFMYQPHDGDPVAVGRIVITPLSVDFADGTSWIAPNPPVLGAPLGSP